MATICNYGAEPVVLLGCAVDRVRVRGCAITMSGQWRLLIYCMNRNLYDKITRARLSINTSMNFWRELLLNGVYLAAVIAVLYILTYTDIVSHWLAY